MPDSPDSMLKSPAVDPRFLEPLDAHSLDQLFREAHTTRRWADRPVPDAILAQAYDLAKMAPTSGNSQPLRILFVRSPEAKARLKPCLSPSNVEQTMAAPVTAIFAMDLEFYEHLPRLYPTEDARSWFRRQARGDPGQCRARQRAAGGILYPGRAGIGPGLRADGRLRPAQDRRDLTSSGPNGAGPGGRASSAISAIPVPAVRGHAIPASPSTRPAASRSRYGSIFGIKKRIDQPPDKHGGGKRPAKDREQGECREERRSNRQRQHAGAGERAPQIETVAAEAADEEPEEIGDADRFHAFAAEGALALQRFLFGRGALDGRAVFGPQLLGDLGLGLLHHPPSPRYISGFGSLAWSTSA